MFVGEHVGKRMPQAVTYFVDAEADIAVQTRVDPDALRYRNFIPELIQGIADCEAAAVLNVKGGQSNISVTTDIDPLIQRIREHQSAIDLDTDLGISYTRIRKSRPTIEVVTDLSVAIKRIVTRSPTIDIQADLDTVAVKWRLAHPSDIDVTTNVPKTVVTRLRNHKSAIDVDADLDISYQRRRNNESTIEVVVDLSALAERAILGSSAIDAQVSLDTIAIRWRNAEANIDTETIVDVIRELVATLFSYNGDVAPGDVVIIDTDDLTVEDATGSNLRKDFEGEWWKIDPNSKEGITWQDGETSRDIELVVEKEDRSV